MPHHTPCPKTQVKTWQLMHNNNMLNTFTVLQYFGENGQFYYKQDSSFKQSYKRFLHSFLIPCLPMPRQVIML